MSLGVMNNFYILIMILMSYYWYCCFLCYWYYYVREIFKWGVIDKICIKRNNNWGFCFFGCVDNVY